MVGIEECIKDHGQQQEQAASSHGVTFDCNSRFIFFDVSVRPSSSFVACLTLDDTFQFKGIYVFTISGRDPLIGKAFACLLTVKMVGEVGFTKCVSMGDSRTVIDSINQTPVYALENYSLSFLKCSGWHSLVWTYPFEYINRSKIQAVHQLAIELITVK
ncbi:hypothetical protein Ancab_025216 [Ancistrocladus abbreviatus]